MDKEMTEISRILSPPIRKILSPLLKDEKNRIEEIRLRYGRPITITKGKEKVTITKISEKDIDYGSPYLVNKNDIERTLQIACNNSPYAFQDEIRQGYITIPGGHRLGVGGKVLAENFSVKRFQYITSLNIRIARQILDIGMPIVPYLTDKKSASFLHTLIVSPPGIGKTTLLRDVARVISNGFSVNYPKKVGIVDERSEIAGSYQGIPQLDIGNQSDVLDSCPKNEGMIMLIRSMSPEVIVVDELGSDDEAVAIESIINAGVTLIASAHGKNIIDIKKRPLLKNLLNKSFFERIIILEVAPGNSRKALVMGVKEEGIYELINEVEI